jgi:predicted nucleic acid-binding protein
LILVDTNVWSELAKPDGDPAVLAWLEANDHRLALSTLGMAEIQSGIELPNAARMRPHLELWLRGLEERYWSYVWHFDADDARAYGRIAASTEAKARDPQIIDLQLAAQALARGATIATRNVKDFAWTGVPVIDPWENGLLLPPNNQSPTPDR